MIVGGVIMFTSKKESVISSIIAVITGILFPFIWYFVLKLYREMRKEHKGIAVNNSIHKLIKYYCQQRQQR